MSRQVKSLQYYPSDFFLGRMNPLSKFTALATISALLFITKGFWTHTGILITCAVLFSFSPFSFINIQGAKVLIVTTVFIGLLQIFFIEDGVPILGVPWLQITDLGVQNAISASARFFSIILISFLFVLTTDPGDFVLSLVKAGLPYRYGYTLITALRMVPMVRSEVRKISYAQIARGLSFSLYPPTKFIKNTRQLLMVVLISMLKRVNQLVISMEGRSFGLYDKRTSLSTINYSWSDIAIIILSISIIPLAIFWR